MEMDEHQSRSAADTSSMRSVGPTHSNKLLENQGAGIYMKYDCPAHPSSLLSLQSPHTFPAGLHGVTEAKHTLEWKKK